MRGSCRERRQIVDTDVPPGVSDLLSICEGTNREARCHDAPGREKERRSSRSPSLQIIRNRQPPKMVPNELIEAIAETLGFLPGPGQLLFVDGPSYVHSHSISGRVTYVNLETRNSVHAIRQLYGTLSCSKTTDLLR